jgi:hypothetical protein
MNSIAEAFKNANIKSNDFKEVEINEEEVKQNLEIEFLEKWLKMLSRNASEKEKYDFIVKHGFLSVKHFNLYISCKDEADMFECELEDARHYLNSRELNALKLNYEQKRNMANSIKNINYYKIMARHMGEKDFSPYGVDLLRYRKESLRYRYKE